MTDYELLKEIEDRINGSTLADNFIDMPINDVRFLFDKAKLLIRIEMVLDDD